MNVPLHHEQRENFQAAKAANLPTLKYTLYLTESNILRNQGCVKLPIFSIAVI